MGNLLWPAAHDIRMLVVTFSRNCCAQFRSGAAQPRVYKHGTICCPRQRLVATSFGAAKQQPSVVTCCMVMRPCEKGMVLKEQFGTKVSRHSEKQLSLYTYGRFECLVACPGGRECRGGVFRWTPHIFSFCFVCFHVGVLAAVAGAVTLVCMAWTVSLDA